MYVLLSYINCMAGVLQMAEAALADEWVTNGDRIALQRRILRLGKPPRRWKRPPWAAVAMREPLEVSLASAHALAPGCSP